MQPYFNPLAAMFEQLWICQRVGATMLKCVEIELCSNPVALAKYCLEPSEKRLNPLEFHGARRSPTPKSQPKPEPRSHRLNQGTAARRHSLSHSAASPSKAHYVSAAAVGRRVQAKA